MDRADVLHGGIAEFVRRAVDHTPANARRPRARRTWPCCGGRARRPLRHRGAAELAGPHDSVSSSIPRCLRSVIKAMQARSISCGLLGNAFLDAAVMVPVLVVELDEAHAPLGQPAGEQAVARRTNRRRAGSRRARASARSRRGCPSARARWPASETPSRTGRCGWRPRGRATSVVVPVVERIDRGDVGPLLLARDAGRDRSDKGPRRPCCEAARPGSGSAESRCSTAARRSAGSGPPCPATSARRIPAGPSASLPRP